MKEAVKKGISFGLASGVITTLGLMIGLNTASGSKIVVIGGILTIAIADAFSDALGIHMSEESNKKIPHWKIWVATFATFFTKFLVACTFLLPFIILNTAKAVTVNIIWGFLLLIVFNYYLSLERKTNPYQAIGVHVGIAAVVIIISNYVGKFIAYYFV